MAFVNWLIGISGDWSVGTNWWDGTTYHAPGAADNAVIAADGTYTVTVSSPVSASSIELDAAGATFSQAAGATLNLANSFSLDSGTAILRSANTIDGGVGISGGLLEMGDSGALGAGELTTYGGELLATGNVTLSNKWDIRGPVTVAAAHNETLTVESKWTVEAGAALTFGTPGANGVVEWGQNGSGASLPYTIDVAGGTLRAGINSGLSFLLQDAATTTVEKDATIDLHDTSPDIVNLQGGGMITDSDPEDDDTIFIDGGNFSGQIVGIPKLAVTGSLTLSGDQEGFVFSGIASGAILTLGAGGRHGSLPGVIDDAGTLVVNHSNVFTLSDNIDEGGVVWQSGTGTTIMNTANSYSGGTTISAGVLSVGNGSALGTGTLTMSGGRLLATATETVANDVALENTVYIAAAHGTTLSIGHNWTTDDGTHIVFGAPGQDGTVMTEIVDGSMISVGSIEVAAGTLAAGDAELGTLLSHTIRTTIDAGAKLDIAGFNAEIFDLRGDGTVTETGAATHLSLDNADFSGVIAGPLALIAKGPATLTGANTFAGGTTIDATGALALGNDGTTGSVTGAIDDEGVLIFNHKNAFTVANVISGGGNVEQIGAGTTTLTRANSYTNQTFILGGTLASAHAGAFGTGHVHLRAGELLATVKQTISNVVATDGNGVIAAAHGVTATLTGDFNVNLDGVGTTLTFGAAGANGTILLESSSVTTSAGYSVDIAAGTLKAATFGFTTLTGGATTNTVEAGATLNFNGFSADVHNLQGGGAITGAGFAVLDIEGGNFAGTIGGKLVIEINGAVTLSGALTAHTSGFIETNANLTLSGTDSDGFQFDGGDATLTLTNPATFTGTLSAFAQTDAIDLTGLKFSKSHFTFNASTDILHVSDGTHAADIHFVDGYTHADFALANDGNGHTLVTTTSAGHSSLSVADENHALALMGHGVPETWLAQFGLG